MKKIILLAIMLGLVGCGENGSSDVTSTTNNQSTELTSNSTQQAFSRSISTHSMTVPFGGWNLSSNPIPLGASAFYEAVNGLRTSSFVLTADASQVAKVLRGGAANIALTIAVDQILGAVDWILDPANNQIVYKNDCTKSDCPTPFMWRTNTYDHTIANNPNESCFKFAQPADTRLLKYVSHTIEKTSYDDIYKCHFVWYSYSSASNSTQVATIKSFAPNPDFEEEKKTLPLQTVAQKIIENADAGSLDAQVATMDAAAQILADAANDQVTQQSIVDQLENNAKCPSGIMSKSGQCWVCTKEDYPVITQRTKLAKVETARLGKCLPEMDNTALFIRINAFNEFVQARVNENSCWVPLDPGHVQQEQDGRNGALKCTNYLK
ncbi:hypothetical protein F4W09_15010 [Acinetobacter tandoii]|uniref:Uncharacterized protein n=1 Tax=Acinetobacter tandoii TaxID=202954 RepID=A0A5N4W2K5_9GAMM|nr:hypothetical protein [Acinetobacter tandoii]KAB1852307.1 hypothetical protein F4W09_15010 [Acinetobacter tandoii]